MSFWKKLFGAKRQPGKILELRSDLTANLSHWESSGEAEAWVLAHLKGWNHQNWLDVLASLGTSSYWPMDEPALGQHLEQLRDALTAKAASSCRLTSAAPPTADVNEKDSQGQTALIRASGAGNRDTVKLLIAAGAQVNVKDNEGRTALIVAAQSGHAGSAEALIHPVQQSMLEPGPGKARLHCTWRRWAITKEWQNCCSPTKPTPTQRPRGARRRCTQQQRQVARAWQNCCW